MCDFYHDELDELNRQIKFWEKEEKNAQSKLFYLNRELSSLKSKKYLAENPITLDQVETPQADQAKGGQRFGDFFSFCSYAKEQNLTKPWVAWNGRLYSMSEAKEGKMLPDTPILFEDIAITF